MTELIPRTGSTTGDGLPHRIGTALSRLALGVRGLLWHEARTAGLTAVQAQAILCLVESPRPLLCGNLAEQFGTTAQTISELLGGLERKGLIERVPSRQDRRQVQVNLTEHGREIGARLIGWDGLLAGQLGELTPSEQGLFYRTLVNLLAELDHSGLVGARVCPGCAHYSGCCRAEGGSLVHHCSYTDLRLSDGELRIDCPDFKTNPT